MLREKNQEQKQKALVSGFQSLDRRTSSMPHVYTPVAPSLTLQRNLGNSYLQAMNQTTINPDGLGIQRACAYSSSCANCSTREDTSHMLQPKLVVGAPNDKYEQEADHVAEQVMGQINSIQSQQLAREQTVQRQEMSGEDEEKEEELQTKPQVTLKVTALQREMIPEEEREEELQTKTQADILQRDALPEDDKAPIESLPEEEICMKPTAKYTSSMLVQLKTGDDRRGAPPEVELGVQRMRGSGTPLPDSVRAPMEQAFGVDFSHVKVHTNAQSDMLNRSLQAYAFTTRQDIFFRRGSYNPESKMGQQLLAHELTHVVQQNSDKLQRKPTRYWSEAKHKREIDPVARLVRQQKDQAVSEGNERTKSPTISILEGESPKSQVLTHLQSLENSQNHHSELYRKEIRKFQQENSTEQMVASQHRILESPQPVGVHQKDSSQTLRRTISCKPSPSPPPSFRRGQILAVNPRNTEGWVVGLRGTTRTSFPDYLKVEYQERRSGRDYFEIKEGPYTGQTASLLPGYLDSSRSWDSAVSVTFNEDSSRSTSLQSRGTLNYGGGTVRAKIFVPGGVAKISANRDYPLALPDAPHAGGSRYGNFAKTWFHIEGGPQGTEYLHRGRRSAGCVTVLDSWPPVYQHLINKRSGNRHIGTIRRVIIRSNP